METIRFDDVDKLRSKVSQEFSAWSKPIDVTQEKINQFADVTGDHQWIHVDIERARRESPFKTPVAHGFLTLSLIPAFEMPRDWNVTSFRNVVNYGANKLRFISPVPAGAKVHARSRVVAVEPTYVRLSEGGLAADQGRGRRHRAAFRRVAALRCAGRRCRSDRDRARAPAAHRPLVL